ARARADPDLAPGGRDGERSDAREHGAVRDRAPGGIEIAEAAPLPDPAQPRLATADAAQPAPRGSVACEGGARGGRGDPRHGGFDPSKRRAGGGARAGERRADPRGALVQSADGADALPAVCYPEARFPRMLDTDALSTYLSDHLAGAQAALALLDRLGSDPVDELDPQALQREIEA